MLKVAGAFLLLFLVTSWRSAGDPDVAIPNHRSVHTPAGLAVSVSETPGVVLLYIEASGDVEPGSVEVRFAGRKLVVLAHDTEGRWIRSERLRLQEPIREETPSADYAADGALVITLRKRDNSRNAMRMGDLEASAP